MQDGRWITRPCDWSRVEALSSALAVSETMATVLVRRGLDDHEEARAFLAAEPPAHDPLALGDVALAVERIRSAVAAQERICVHGDYDVDGISATAVAVLVLRELGATVEWRLPSRFEEGYGLAPETIEQLAEDGVDLVLTVDCGITAVDEVARARELGLDVIVTDHHRPAEALPDCPIVATRPSDYPCPELCGTGVVYTLARALLGDDHPRSRESSISSPSRRSRTSSRSWTRTARSPRPASVRWPARPSRPAGADAGGAGGSGGGRRDRSRVPPRAADQRGRPPRTTGFALELLLTDDRVRARELASTLEDLNRERQGVEERILREALATVDTWSPEARARRGYVLWSEEWHEGVIGIVASRLVERFQRPVVLVARSGDGWKGSGRSIPDFDLHGGLAACASHLERFGGHRAAAGLTIATEQLDAFADAFGVHADTVLADADLRPLTTVDAIVPAGPSRSTSRRSSTAWPRSASETPSRRFSSRASRPQRPAQWGGEASPLPRTPAGSRRRLRDRVRPGRSARSATEPASLRRCVPAEGEPLERHGRAAARRAPRVRRGRSLRGSPNVACGSVAGRGGRLDTRCASHLRRLGLSEGARRQLLESQSFRAILERGSLELPLAA